VDASLPGYIEIHARDGCKQIDAVRRSAELHHLFRDCECPGIEPDRAEAELLQDAEKTLRIIQSWADEEINIAGEARVAVEGNRITTDDQALNSVRVQQLDELSQIFLQFHRATHGSEL